MPELRLCNPLKDKLVETGSAADGFILVHGTTREPPKIRGMLRAATAGRTCATRRAQ